MSRPRPQLHQLSEDDWDQALNNNVFEDDTCLRFATPAVREEYYRIMKEQRNQKVTSTLREKSPHD